MLLEMLTEWKKYLYLSLSAQYKTPNSILTWQLFHSWSVTNKDFLCLTFSHKKVGILPQVLGNLELSKV